MIWECNIRKIQNGYILARQEEVEEGKFETRELVFEESCETSDIINIVPLLTEVAEYFGITYSKHNSENLIIRSTWEEEHE